MSGLDELRHVRAAKGQLDAGSKADARAARLFLAPWFLGLAIITIGPMLASLALSFTRYNLLRPPRFIGVDNFVRMIGDERFYRALGVTFGYVFTSVPLQLVVSLGLAIILNRGLRGLAIYRSVFYLPSLLGGSVAIAAVWRTIFGGDGVLNQVLGFFGIHGQSWIATPETALWTLIGLNVWTFGSPMVIFLAGLRQIPQMYHEAAAIDGAGTMRRFVHITLPLLTPIIFFNLVLQVIHAFQAFTQAYIVSGGTGGPSDSTLFFTLYLYERGFTNYDMGYAAALAWVLVLIIAAFTAVAFWSSKWWVFYDD